jgi:hypothetical protein
MQTFSRVCVRPPHFLGREAMHHPIPLPIASRDAWFTRPVAWSSLMCRPRANHAANIGNK